MAGRPRRSSTAPRPETGGHRRLGEQEYAASKDADIDRLVVFISSAIPRPRYRQQIMADRLAATAAARTLRAFFSVWTWENCAFPGRFKPDALYLEKAAEAHVLILLIDDRLSVNTKREYDASVRNRRSQMILFREGAKLDPSARDFKRKLRGATYWQYGNEDELRTIIYRGLRMNMLRYAKIGMKASIGTRVEYSELGV